jgi:hypothetical protein
MSCHQYPTRASAVGDGGVRSLWDNVASSLGMAAQSREVAPGFECAFGPAGSDPPRRLRLTA